MKSATHAIYLGLVEGVFLRRWFNCLVGVICVSKVCLSFYNNLPAEADKYLSELNLRLVRHVSCRGPG